MSNTNQTLGARQASFKSFLQNLPGPFSSSSTNGTHSALQRQASIKSGWLRKEGGLIKSWHMRWFTLKGDQLYYYARDDDSKPLGNIFLPGNRVVEQPFNVAEPDKFMFEIIPGGDKSRMTSTHETYPLCAASEEERKDWIRAIRKVMYADKGGAIFGQTLTETMAYESRTGNRLVPEIIEKCVEFLLKEGLEVEGLFRLPGRTALVRGLKEQFDQGEQPVFELPDTDVHSVASLLKMYMRELPEPIIPYQFYEPVMKLVTRDMHQNPDKSISRLANLLENIPRHNYNLLKYISHFLSEVSKNSHVNKMSEMNLATVFSLCVIRPEVDDPALLMGTSDGRSQVVFVLLSKWHSIFKLEYNAHGASIQVDKLLDFEGGSHGQPAFSASTSTPAVPVTRGSNTSQDLLDLDLPGAPITDPMLPAVVLQPDSVTKPTIVPSRSAPVPQSTDVTTKPESQSKESPTPVRPARHTKSDSRSKLDPTPEESPPPVRPAPVPVPKPAESAVTTAIKPVEEPLCPSRPAPKPSGSPPRPKPRPAGGIINGRPGSRSNSFDGNLSDTPGMNGSSVDSLPSQKMYPDLPSSPTELSQVEEALPRGRVRLSVLEYEEEQADEEALNALLNKDLSGYSEKDLRKHTEILCSELRARRSKYQSIIRDLKAQYAKKADSHQVKMQDMAKQLSAEKQATSNAVNKIVILQTQLQQYQLLNDMRK